MGELLVQAIGELIVWPIERALGRRKAPRVFNSESRSRHKQKKHAKRVNKAGEQRSHLRP